MFTRVYVGRLALCLVWFAFTSYLNALAATVAGFRTPNIVVLDLEGQPTSVKTLPDVGHDIFRRLVLWWDPASQFDHIDYFELPDVFMTFVGVSTVIFIAVHPQRLLVLRRMTAVFGFINFLRAICVACTSLPDASPHCQSQFGDPARGAYKHRPVFGPRTFRRAWLLLLEPSRHTTCGDMIFSGHTVLLVMCSMVFDTYCNKRECDTPLVRALPAPALGFLKFMIYSATGAGIFAIIGTRLHYSLDVLIAVYLTWRTWSGYHQRTLMIPHMQRVDPRMYQGCGFFRVVKWLEADTVTAIDTFAYRKARERLRSVDLDDECGEDTISLAAGLRPRHDSEPPRLVPTPRASARRPPARRAARDEPEDESGGGDSADDEAVARAATPPSPAPVAVPSADSAVLRRRKRF